MTHDVEPSPKSMCTYIYINRYKNIYMQTCIHTYKYIHISIYIYLYTQKDVDIINPMSTFKISPLRTDLRTLLNSDLGLPPTWSR